MRILICSEQAPLPPVNGIRLVMRALVGELAPRHELRMLSFGPPEHKDVTQIDGVPIRVLPRDKERRKDVALHLGRALFTGRPMRADGYAAQMRSALDQELTGFDPDVVHVMTGGLAVLGRQLIGRPAVLVGLDAAHRNVEDQAVESRPLRRRLLFGEAGRVRRFEAEEYGRFARVVVVSEGDRAALHTVAPALTIDVIPNGVDSDFFAPGSADERRGVVVFHGAMDYAPNVRAAEYLGKQIWPRVLALRPDAELTIVGRAPVARVRSLAAMKGIKVTGEVPDVRPWLTGSRVYACPMLTGTGIKNKLLEAMACGMACVATPLALSGMTAVPDRDLLVAEGEDALAAAIARLLADAQLSERLGRAARDYVRANHDWGAVAAAYEQVYDAAVSSHRHTVRGTSGRGST
jgi:glycosyltransferase involved in cell wall biosynthesis